MIAAEWNEVGVLVGKLFALEPPFVQICIALAAAFCVLMMIEGLRASFTRREVPLRRKSVQAIAHDTEPSTYRGRQASPAARRLKDNAIKSHSAPRPKIQRRPSPALQAAPPEPTALPHVASFDE